MYTKCLLRSTTRPHRLVVDRHLLPLHYLPQQPIVINL